jgi:tetratricopeptide (TPR) repeat protein
METLYDLLGALPRDDADELRSAFRRAVKGAHPDLNPNDPLAGQKFREIVRANDILGDEDQRAAYDHLLDLAHREERKKKTAKVIHKTASSAIALVAVATFGLGTYGAYKYSPTFAAALNQVAGVVLVQPGDFASVTPQTPMKPQPALEKALAAFAKALPAPSDAQSLPVTVVKTEAVIPAPKTGSAETTVQIASFEPPVPEKAQTAPEPIVVPATVASSAPAAHSDRASTASASVGPPLEISPGDAKVHRERGVFAYRSGDYNAAVAEFDRAIRLDPNFSAAYVDRSIVLYRMQRFERAFADIAQAKRLEKASRATRIAAARKKIVEVTAAVGIAPFFQPRTARLEATTP